MYTQNVKKILPFILIGAIVGSGTVFAASRFFPDVPKNAWFENAAKNLSEKGIIEGYSDGTFGPSKKVTRAELAVMLDRTIEYIQTGNVTKPAPSTNTENEIAFDDCGPLSKYQNHPWFPGLNEKYAQGNYMEKEVGTGSEACLALDESYFIFIPEDFASASHCGQIFRYDLAAGHYNGVNAQMEKATGQKYCAKEFQQRIDNYIKFSGKGQKEDFSCVQYAGKYFFEENRVEVTTEEC